MNAWESLSDFPGPDRLNPKILSMDGKIFIFGGQNNIYPNSPIYDVWVYHINNDTWEEKYFHLLSVSQPSLKLAQNFYYPIRLYTER